jgi:3-hydroxymyristoyl/3-hydroxydecanoyl-(acyl carrier protein) dehydratase
VRGASQSQLEPEFLSERRGDSHHEFDLRVPAHLAVWPGHFPEFFLVPGVLQVDWVLRIASDRLGLVGAPRRIEALKFKKPLRPQQLFTLSLDVAADGCVFEFEMAGTSEVFSTGRFHLDRAPR